jgi:hypothetical protein
MRNTLRTRPRLATALSTVALVGLAVTPLADAAVPTTGVWRGESVPEFRSLPVTDNMYKPRIVISELNGRLVGVVATVRLECAEPLSVSDVRVVEGWRVNRGPRVSRSGSFSFHSDNNVWIHGTLSRGRAVGEMSLSKAACSAHSAFNIPRGRY